MPDKNQEKPWYVRERQSADDRTSHDKRNRKITLPAVKCLETEEQ